jgi:TRAP transporter TAXI family solute receptor
MKYRPFLASNRKIFSIQALSILALVFLVSCTDQMSQSRPYVLTTATTGGTYYPVGVAIATIAHAQLSESHGISMTAISSAGSLENVKLLRDNQAQFALLQGPFGAWAWSGEGPISQPQTQMRSVSAMWHNVEHFDRVNRERRYHGSGQS